jgi:hypothetical protein
MRLELVHRIDEGTRNPIVARLGLQATDLLQWLDVSEEKRGEIAALYVRNLIEKLLACSRRGNEIRNQLNSLATNTDTKGYQNTPYIANLEDTTHMFLYQSKNFMRDVLKIFQILHDKIFSDASCLIDIKGCGQSEVAKWAVQKFGKDSRMAGMFDDDTMWVAEPIWKRNAVEHPGGKSGTLKITNIRRLTALGGALQEPTWQRGEGVISSIARDMEIIVENMLTFAEEILVTSILDAPTHPMIDIYEIPLVSRDADCPVRFKVGPNAELSAKISAAIKREADNK